MTTLHPVVQSAKITILYLYLYWGKPVSASERSGRECFPCWTCPALPRLWYCCGLPSCRARLPVIGLPFSSHHLSALWIQLQGPKRTTTLQLKRLICLSPISSASPPSAACCVFINTHLSLFLWIFSFPLFFGCILLPLFLHGKAKGDRRLAYFCLSRHVFFLIVLSGYRVFFFSKPLLSNLCLTQLRFWLKYAASQSKTLKKNDILGRTLIVAKCALLKEHILLIKLHKKCIWHYSNSKSCVNLNEGKNLLSCKTKKKESDNFSDSCSCRTSLSLSTHTLMSVS